MTYRAALFIMCAVFIETVASAPLEQRLDLGLKQAVAHRQLGQYDKAIEQLEHLRPHYLTHKRLNVELAINYIKLGRYQQAQQILAHLQSLPLSDKERDKVMALVRLIDKPNITRPSGHQFDLHLIAAAGTDSKSSSIPLYEMIEYYEWDEFGNESVDTEWLSVRTVEEQENQRYVSQSVSLQYRYVVPSLSSIFGDQSQFIFDNELNYSSKNNDDHTKIDYDLWRVASAFKLINNQNWAAEINVSADRYLSAGNTLFTAYQLGVVTQKQIEQTRFRFGIDYQENHTDSERYDYGAQLLAPWSEVLWRYNALFTFELGARFSQYKANDPYNSYDNVNISAGVYFYPSAALSSYLFYRSNNLFYTFDNLDEVNWSKEVKDAFSVGVKYTINANWSVGLNGSLTFKKSDNDYINEHWQRAELFIKWQF